MNKVNAYTLMEVTVAMLLSAICISISYTCWGIIEKYFDRMQQKQDTAAALTSLTNVLQKDFSKSNYVLKTNEGLELLYPDGKINYTLTDGSVLRSLELHTDTFKVATGDVRCSFEHQEINEPDTVDRLTFTAFLNGGLRVPVQINKQYSAADLLK